MEISSRKTKITDAGSKGRGVFALQPISSCEVIEVAPLIIIEGKIANLLLMESELSDYVYDFTYTDLSTQEDIEASALALGHASMYNTDDNSNPNATFDVDIVAKTVTVSALRDIRPGEEITIAYEDEADALREELVDLAMAVSELKLKAKNKGYNQDAQNDFAVVQNAIHHLTSTHFPDPDEDDAPW
jgi:SET domain-containing protein